MKGIGSDQLIAELDTLASLAAGAALLAERTEVDVEVRQQAQPAIRKMIELIAKRLNELARRIDDART
ncbi:MAG: hypothetical protein JST54_27110 [Deltaproteobacteria bacterium]|nr:hypothetical protein [Deltaproteobacteria bacterium]